jgi:hypothetical protein
VAQFAGPVGARFPADGKILAAPGPRSHPRIAIRAELRPRCRVGAKPGIIVGDDP